MCFERPINIKCEVFSTLDEIGFTEITADETEVKEEKEKKVPVDLDKIITKRRIKQDERDHTVRGRRKGTDG